MSGPVDPIVWLRRDPVMARLIDRYPLADRLTIEVPGKGRPIAGADAAGGAPVREDPTQRIFVDLIDAITSQQLSVKAAASIMDRVLDLFPEREPSPATLRDCSDDQLRTAGLSRPKIRYIRGIATAIDEGSFVPSELPSLPDDQVIARLTALNGVGRWTAEMLLLFSLHRPDVFALGDLGLRTAVARHYGVDRDDTAAIETIAERWRPYRSLASRYLWQSLENAPLN